MTLTVDVDPEFDQRLEDLSQRTGETKADLLRNVLRNGLEEVEDYFSAAEILKRLDRGEERTYPLDEVMQELGLEH